MTTSRELAHLLHEIRMEYPGADLVTLLQLARNRGFTDENDLALTIAFYHGRFGQPFPHAEFVDQFIVDYLAPTPPAAILDPFAGLGTSLARLVRRFRPAVAVGIEYLAELADVARYLYEDENIDWRVADAVDELKYLDLTFDAIIGNPPWGGPARKVLFPPADPPLRSGVAGKQLEARVEPGYLGLLRAARLLRPGGAAFFVVPPSSFLRRPDSRAVAATLARYGLHVHAALTLPRSVFPATTVNAVLIIIRR